MGSDDSHFNVALTAADIDRSFGVLRPVNHYGYISIHKTTTVAVKGEPSKRGIEPASSVLPAPTPYRRAKPAHAFKTLGHILL